MPLHKSTALIPLVHCLAFSTQTLSSVCFLREIVSWFNTPYRHVLSPAIGFTGSYLYSAPLCLLSNDAKSSPSSGIKPFSIYRHGVPL